MSDGYRPRRVITGHDSSGRSVVLSDGPTPVVGSLPCRVAFILIDGTFAPELLDALAAGAKDTTMRHAG